MLLNINETHSEKHYATVQGFLSPYDQASAYIQDYRSWRTGSFGHRLRRQEDYEKPFFIRMSLKDWFKLKSDMNWGESDEAYPRLSYNASKSILIIQCMPSPLNESIGSLLPRQFILSQANLPQDYVRGLQTVSAQDYHGFDGRWEGSGKRPDLGIKTRNANGQYELKWVLETGFAEPYQDLMDDAQLWLEGYPEVSMVVLVKLKEAPSYSCPISPDTDPERLGIPSRPLDIRPEDIILEGELGPAVYQGLVWVRQISEAWMEIWVRDVDGKAIRRGNRKDLLQDAQIQIPLADFLTLPPGSDGTIIVDLEDFRYSLKKGVPELAVHRCRGTVIDYRKRIGHDEGYQP